MRVFVAYGYLPGEKWIEELVIPMLEQMGLFLLHGKEIPGTQITPELERRIESSDALIGLLTKRRKGRGSEWATSDYVKEEIYLAHGLKKPVVQIVEQGVRTLGGTLAGIQRISFKSRERDRMLVALAMHVRQWIHGEMKIRSTPDALADAVATNLRRTKCTYKIFQDSRLDREGIAELIPEGGGIFAKLIGFLPGTYVQVEILTPQGQHWLSSLQSHSSPYNLIKLQPHV